MSAKKVKLQIEILRVSDRGAGLLRDQFGREIWVMPRTCKLVQQGQLPKSVIKNLDAAGPRDLQAVEAGKKAHQAEFKKAANSLVEVPVSWQNEKSIGVDFECEVTDSAGNQRYTMRVREFCSKRLVRQGSKMPQWLFDQWDTDAELKAQANADEKSAPHDTLTSRVIGFWESEMEYPKFSPLTALRFKNRTAA